MNNIPQYLNIEYSNKYSGYSQTTVLEYDENRHIYISQSQYPNNYINLVWKGKNCKIPGMWPRMLRKGQSGCWLLTIDNQEWVSIRSRQEINNGISADQWIPNARSTNALSPIYRIYVSPLRRRPPPTEAIRIPAPPTTEAIRIPLPNPAPDRDIWDSVFHSRDQKTRSPDPQITTIPGLANLTPLSTTSRFGNNLGGGKSRKKLRKYRKSRKYKKLRRKHSRYKKYKSSRKYKL